MTQGYLTIGEVVEFGRLRFGFTVEAGETGLRRPLESAAVSFFDETEPWQGGRENETGLPVLIAGCWRPGLSSRNHCIRLETLVLEGHVPLIICSRARLGGYFPLFRSLADRTGTVLVTSPEDPWLIGSRMTAYLKRRIEGSVSLQGGLVEVGGMGVLIRGESGSGKTSCALELIRRGHRLVADDRVDMQAVGGETLLATSPSSIKNLMHIQGLGIVDVAALFGSEAVSDRAVVGLCCEVKREGRTGLMNSEAEGLARSRLLNQCIPTLALPFRNAMKAADRIEQAVGRLLSEGPWEDQWGIQTGIAEDRHRA